MTARELLNLIDWLRAQGFSNEKVIECLEKVEGRKNVADSIITSDRPQEGE